MARLSIKDIAQDMGYPINGVRQLAYLGKLPFIDFITPKSKNGRHTLYVNAERYKLWKEGKL